MPAGHAGRSADAPGTRCGGRAGAARGRRAGGRGRPGWPVGGPGGPARRGPRAGAGRTAAVRRPVLQAAGAVAPGRQPARPAVRGRPRARARGARLRRGNPSGRPGLGGFLAERSQRPDRRPGHPHPLPATGDRARRLRAAGALSRLDLAGRDDHGRRPDPGTRLPRRARPPRGDRRQRTAEPAARSRTAGRRRRRRGGARIGQPPEHARLAAAAALPRAPRPICCARAGAICASLRARNVPLLWGHAVVAAEGTDELQAVQAARLDAYGAATPSPALRFEADTLCLGYGFIPSTELARMLGCEHRVADRHLGYLATVTGDDGATSLPGVFVVGDGADMGGSRVALARGTLAGVAAARNLGLRASDAVEGAGPAAPGRMLPAGAVVALRSAARRAGRGQRRHAAVPLRGDQLRLGARTDPRRPRHARRAEAQHAARHGTLPGPLLRGHGGQAGQRDDGPAARGRAVLRAPAAGQAGAGRRARLREARMGRTQARDHAEPRSAGRARPLRHGPHRRARDRRRRARLLPGLLPVEGRPGRHRGRSRRRQPAGLGRQRGQSARAAAVLRLRCQGAARRRPGRGHPAARADVGAAVAGHRGRLRRRPRDQDHRWPDGGRQRGRHALHRGQGRARTQPRHRCPGDRRQRTAPALARPVGPAAGRRTVPHGGQDQSAARDLRSGDARPTARRALPARLRRRARSNACPATVPASWSTPRAARSTRAAW